MNWLAHSFLSKPNIEFRVGNLLPDLVSISELKKFSPAFQEGIDCHRAIDRFTDAHPIVKAGIRRLPANYRRYGGILTDVFYDHFLAVHWHKYSAVNLGEFTDDFRAQLKFLEGEMPQEILRMFHRILENKIFEGYKHVEGIKIALQRIDLRLKRPANLSKAIVALENDYVAYEKEFFEFFDQLQTYVSPYLDGSVSSLTE